MLIRATTGSPDATRELAAALAGLARPGDILLLVGDLGAGKTAFVQGFGTALDVDGPITSPTFTLVHTYPGRLQVNHLDVYRIEQLDEVMDLALPELLDEAGVTLIEWGDTIAGELPAEFLEVRLTFGEGDDERHVHVRPVGPGWMARARPLRASLARWVEHVDGVAGC